MGLVLAGYGLTRPSPPDPVPTFGAGGSPAGTYGYDNVDQLSGSWILAGDGESYVGYRIDVKPVDLAPAYTVTGRTNALQAFMGVSGRDVSNVAVEADLTRLTSGDPERDVALRTRGLETERFPKAVFVLGTSVNLSTIPPPSSEATFHVVGELRLHGKVHALEVDLKARVIPGNPPVVEVIGAQTVRLADFGIDPPNVAGILDVKDTGVLEFKLRFLHA